MEICSFGEDGMNVSTEVVAPVLEISAEQVISAKAPDLLKHRSWNKVFDVFNSVSTKAEEVRNRHEEIAKGRPIWFDLKITESLRVVGSHRFEGFTFYVYSFFMNPEDAAVGEGVVPEAFGDVGSNQYVSIRVLKPISPKDVEIQTETRSFKRIYFNADRFCWLRES